MKDEITYDDILAGVIFIAFVILICLTPDF
jgi:hypothetical protein